MESNKVWKTPIPHNIDKQFGKDYLAADLYLLLLRRARLSDSKNSIILNNQSYDLKKGQLLYGRRKVAERLRCSPSGIDKALERLLAKKLIKTFVSKGRQTIIEVENIDEITSLKVATQVATQVDGKVATKVATEVATYLQPQNLEQTALSEGDKNKSSHPSSHLSSHPSSHSSGQQSGTNKNEYNKSAVNKNKRKGSSTPASFKRSLDYLRSDECKNQLLIRFPHLSGNKTRLEDLIERMVDWHRGKGRVIKDYPATLRNWLRNDVGYEREKKASGKGAVDEASDLGKRWRDKLIKN